MTIAMKNSGEGGTPPVGNESLQESNSLGNTVSLSNNCNSVIVAEMQCIF